MDYKRMKKHTELVNLVLGLTEDCEKIENGNKAARTRVRVGLQEVKKLAQELRVEINNLD